MAATTEISFPNQHSTTTTTTREALISPEIRYDPTYWRTLEGILKVVVIVFNLIGFIILEASAFTPITRSNFFCSVAMIGFWFSLLLLVMYLFHVVEKFYKLPWVQIEMVVYLLLAIFYLIASIWVACYPVSSFHAAAFFGFIAMIIYGFESFKKYEMYRAGFLAQSQKQRSTVRVQTA